MKFIKTQCQHLNITNDTEVNNLASSLTFAFHELLNVRQQSLSGRVEKKISVLRGEASRNGLELGW